ncbi:MAG: DNA polymerase IV [Oscillospiraceae bacterium]|nr:DNA polymerase IV [Oscillospiraceae bacterium]
MANKEQARTRIVHVDMDAFYAAVEVRDNPSLAGKSLIIGALPHERGVVCTCSYEARKFGVRSAMSIKEAYRRCPQGIYMYPDLEKYAAVSREVHKIWADYTDICEYLSLDEGFLDVTDTAHHFGGAAEIAHAIKRRTREALDLTCSVGVGYSMMAAKLASEEKKPDGFFEILTPADLQTLIADRSVRTIYGVGPKTAEALQSIGITTVRQIWDNPDGVIALLGNYGKQIVELAEGIDRRRVTPYMEPKSIGMEQTFQRDTTDLEYLKYILFLTAEKLSADIRQKGVYAQTITLKVTYSDMKSITRSKTGDATDHAADIYGTAAALLDKIEERPIRLIGISLSGLTPNLQLSLFGSAKEAREDKLSDKMRNWQSKYGQEI